MNSTRARVHGPDTVGVMLAASWAAGWADDEAVAVSVRVALPNSDRSLPGRVQVPPDVAATLTRNASGMWAADLSRRLLERGLLGGSGSEVLLLRVHLLNVTVRWREDGGHPEAQYSRAIREQVSAALGADGYGVREEFESGVRTGVVEAEDGAAHSVYMWRDTQYNASAVGELLWWLVHANLQCHGLHEKEAYKKIEVVVAMCDIRVGRLKSHPKVRVVVPPDHSPVRYLDDKGDDLTRYSLPCKWAHSSSGSSSSRGGSGRGLSSGTSSSGGGSSSGSSSGTSSSKATGGGAAGGVAGGGGGTTAAAATAAAEPGSGAGAPNGSEEPNLRNQGQVGAAGEQDSGGGGSALAAAAALLIGLLSTDDRTQFYVTLALHAVVLILLGRGNSWRALGRCRTLLCWAFGRRPLGSKALSRREEAIGTGAAALAPVSPHASGLGGSAAATAVGSGGGGSGGVGGAGRVATGVGGQSVTTPAAGRAGSGGSGSAVGKRGGGSSSGGSGGGGRGLNSPQSTPLARRSPGSAPVTPSAGGALAAAAAASSLAEVAEGSASGSRREAVPWWRQLWPGAGLADARDAAAAPDPDQLAAPQQPHLQQQPQPQQRQSQQHQQQLDSVKRPRSKGGSGRRQQATQPGQGSPPTASAPATELGQATAPGAAAARVQAAQQQHQRPGSVGGSLQAAGGRPVGATSGAGPLGVTAVAGTGAATAATEATLKSELAAPDAAALAVQVPDATTGRGGVAVPPRPPTPPSQDPLRQLMATSGSDGASMSLAETSSRASDFSGLESEVLPLAAPAAAAAAAAAAVAAFGANASGSCFGGLLSPRSSTSGGDASCGSRAHSAGGVASVGSINGLLAAAAGAAAALTPPPLARTRVPVQPWSLAVLAEMAGKAAAMAPRDPTAPLPGSGGGGGGLALHYACLLCRDAPREHGFLHGGSVHVGVCGECAGRLVAAAAAAPGGEGCGPTCPVCLQPADRMVEVIL